MPGSGLMACFAIMAALSALISGVNFLSTLELHVWWPEAYLSTKALIEKYALVPLFSASTLFEVSKLMQNEVVSNTPAVLLAPFACAAFMAPSRMSTAVSPSLVISLSYMSSGCLYEKGPSAMPKYSLFGTAAAANFIILSTASKAAFSETSLKLVLTSFLPTAANMDTFSECHDCVVLTLLFANFSCETSSLVTETTASLAPRFFRSFTT